MNRRDLVLKTMYSALSASVFTATGWLMGARTLTMPTIAPCSGSQVCSASLCIETCFVWPGQTCSPLPCAPPYCANCTTTEMGCMMQPCNCYCELRMSCGGCGGCGPCPN